MPTKGGGYQVVEGNTDSGAVYNTSPVMGKGRVTPRFPLQPTLPIKTAEELEEEKRKQMLALEFRSLLDDERQA